jgi:hypothetical protein
MSAFAVPRIRTDLGSVFWDRCEGTIAWGSLRCDVWDLRPCSRGPGQVKMPRWISLNPRAPIVSSRMSSGVHRSPSSSTPVEIGV